MTQAVGTSARAQRGFTLIEILVVVLIVGLLGAIAVPAYQGSIRKARRVALVGDARNFHDAMTRYHVDEGSYPADFGPSAMDTATLEPLVSQGYYPQAASFTAKLESGRLLFYFAPDIDGVDNQYISVMRHTLDSTLILLVADTNLLGTYYEGVYVLDNGSWVRVDEAS